MTTEKPFVMTCSVDGWLITFLLRANGKTAVRVSNNKRILVGVDNQSEAAKLAAELVDVDLWPAFANSLKPSCFAEQLFTSYENKLNTVLSRVSGCL